MSWKNLLFILFLGFLFVEVLIIFPQKIEKLALAPESEVNTENQKLGIGHKMGDVHLVESQKGFRDWELYALSATGTEGKGHWNIKGVKVLFYNHDRLEFTVTGDEGTIDSQTKNMDIRGHVETKSSNGYIFQSKAISYLASKREITSPEDITMLGPSDEHGQGLKVSGKKLIAFVAENRMLIPGEVQAEKEIKNGRKFQIRSDAVEFKSDSKEAKFTGKVAITYENMKISGPDAKFIYGSGADILSSIQLDGGVKVTDENKLATSDKLSIDFLSNKFVFKGKPRLIQDDDELTGDEIVFIDNGKKIKIEKSKELK